MKAEWGILLAAGRGLRLGAHNGGRAKALLPVLGQPLLAYAMTGLRAVAERVLVVGGCDAEEVFAAVQRLDGDAVCVENPDFCGQNLQSLACALERIASGSLHVCNVDHIKSKAMVRAIRRAPGVPTAFGRHTTECADPDVMKVGLSRTGQVRAMAKTLQPFQGIYAGDFHCSAAAHGHFRRAVASALRRRGADRAVTEDAIVELSAAGTPVVLGELADAGWLEVDTAGEHAAVERELGCCRGAFVHPEEYGAL